jgi:hypothetical protein
MPSVPVPPHDGQAKRAKKRNRSQRAADARLALWREDLAWSAEHFPTETLDPGIVRVLRIFKEAGIETCQSCEGPDAMQPEGRHGVGHAYHKPTIDITYQPWAALDVAMQHDIRVDRISEVFRVENWRPVEQLWRVEFNSRQMTEFRESWYGKVSV